MYTTKEADFLRSGLRLDLPGLFFSVFILLLSFFL